MILRHTVFSKLCSKKYQKYIFFNNTWQFFTGRDSIFLWKNCNILQRRYKYGNSTYVSIFVPYWIFLLTYQYQKIWGSIDYYFFIIFSCFSEIFQYFSWKFFLSTEYQVRSHIRVWYHAVCCHWENKIVFIGSFSKIGLATAARNVETDFFLKVPE